MSNSINRFPFHVSYIAFLCCYKTVELRDHYLQRWTFIYFCRMQFTLIIVWRLLACENSIEKIVNNIRRVVSTVTRKIWLAMVTILLLYCFGIYRIRQHSIFFAQSVCIIKSSFILVNNTMSKLRKFPIKLNNGMPTFTVTVFTIQMYICTYVGMYNVCMRKLCAICTCICTYTCNWLVLRQAWGPLDQAKMFSQDQDYFLLVIFLKN